MASQAVLMNGPVALLFAVILLLLSSAAAGVNGFQLLPVSTVVSRHHTSQHTRGRALFNSANNDEAITEAERLLSKAKAIREELGSHNTNNQQLEGKSPIHHIRSEFCLSATSSGSNNNDYRLYLDVGREPGTWMDPRWGASGRRIECTIDVSFSSVDEEEQSLSEEITSGLIKTVTTKSSKLSQVLKLQHAPFARLRSGFDKMKISEGGYCIESASKSSTMRFCLSVNGTEGSTASYGDVSIPQGNLYFALPYFGTSQSDGSISISKKEGTICVKQFGWNTGWRREESRILGVFRAVPLVEARRRDKF